MDVRWSTWFCDAGPTVYANPHLLQEEPLWYENWFSSRCFERNLEIACSRKMSIRWLLCHDVFFEMEINIYFFEMEIFHFHCWRCSCWTWTISAFDIPNKLRYKSIKKNGLNAFFRCILSNKCVSFLNSKEFFCTTLKFLHKAFNVYLMHFFLRARCFMAPNISIHHKSGF